MSLNLIIGGSGTLGKVLVNKFSENGNCIFTYNKSKAPSTPKCIHLDLFSEESVGNFISSMSSRKIHSIIFNAAYNENRLMLYEKGERLLENINAFIINQKRIALALRSGLEDASIIFISSIVGLRGSAGQTVYSAVKGATVGLCHELALELADIDCRVNTVIPGIFRSNLSESLDEGKLQNLINQNILAREQDLNEIVNFIHHLSGMRNVSAQVFNLDSRALNIL